MGKNRFINILLTMIMLLSTILTPQLAHTVSASLDKDVETEEQNEDPNEVVSEEPVDDDAKGDNGGEGQVIDTDKEESDNEKESTPEATEKDEDKTPADTNNNDPPAAETEDSVEEDADADEDKEEISLANANKSTEVGADEIYFPKVEFTDINGNSFTADRPYNLDSPEIGHLSFTWALIKNHTVTEGDTYGFQLPEQFEVTNATFGELDNIGVWTVTKDGYVQFTFKEAVDADEVNGTFWFEVSLVVDELEQEREQEIIIPIGETHPKVEINVYPKGSSLISKSGTINNNGFNSDGATWTVDINTGLDTLVNPSVTDTIPNNMVFQANSVEVYNLSVDVQGNKSLGDPLDPDKYSVVPDANGNPVISLKNLTDEEAQQAYRITYKTDIIEPEAGFDG